MEHQVFLLQFRVIRTFTERGMTFNAERFCFINNLDGHEISDDELVTTGNALEDWRTLQVYLTKDESEKALEMTDQKKYKHRVYEAIASGTLAEIIDRHNKMLHGSLLACNAEWPCVFCG